MNCTNFPSGRNTVKICFRMRTRVRCRMLSSGRLETTLSTTPISSLCSNVLSRAASPCNTRRWGKCCESSWARMRSFSISTSLLGRMPRVSSADVTAPVPAPSSMVMPDPSSVCAAMVLVRPLLLGRTAPTWMGLRNQAERKLGLAFNACSSFWTLTA